MTARLVLVDVVTDDAEQAEVDGQAVNKKESASQGEVGPNEPPEHVLYDQNGFIDSSTVIDRERLFCVEDCTAATPCSCRR